MTELLGVHGLVARHGLLTAVREVSLSLAQGEVLALVGANGSGKSTLLRAIAGAHRPVAGTIRFGGTDITGLAAHQRVACGIALVPEGRKLFADMTVEENLRVARGRIGPWRLDSVADAFPMLKPLMRQRASSLSGGQQQAAAIARALMTNPRLLLIDEISLGLSPVAVEAVYGSVRRLIGEGTSLLIVEQDLNRALSIASKLVCFREGRVVLAETPSQVTRDQVRAAYFGLTPKVAVLP